MVTVCCNRCCKSVFAADNSHFSFVSCSTDAWRSQNITRRSHHHQHHHQHHHYYHHHAGTTHLELSLFFSDKSKLVLDFQLLASHPLQVLTQLGLVVVIVSLDGDLDDDDDDPGEW